jgi:hypothetical protein
VRPTPTIDQLLELRTVAVVGASRDGRQLANEILRTLRDGGRRVLAVNPAADGAPIEGEPSFRSVRDLPPEVEGVFVVVPPASIDGVVAEALARGITNIWLHRGIGTPMPPSEVVDRARAAGAVVVAGECPLMFLEPVHGVHRLHRALHRTRTA